DPLVPQPREKGEALRKLFLAHLPGLDRPGVLGMPGRDVRPPGEQVALLEGKVEQRREHLGGEVDRDPLHQSKGSPTGSDSTTSITRERMRPSNFARYCGPTMGLTALRCSSWRGGSISMKLGRISSGLRGISD